MLQLSAIHKAFQQPDGAIAVLQGANLVLKSGESAALLGESGSGKSTLLHLIAGLDRPDSGDILFQGRSTQGFTESEWTAFRRRDLSLVFQQYHLIPTLSVRDNVRLQARLNAQLDAELESHLLNRLGLSALTERLPHQLSGGQQQRVAIARALLHRPALVLADEPTGNLDERSSEAVMTLLTELIKETGCSLLMVTHSQAMAAFLDHRWYLHNGQLMAESA